MSVRVLFVADGTRDEAVVPRLVARLLGVPVAAEFGRVAGGKGVLAVPQPQCWR